MSLSSQQKLKQQTKLVHFGSIAVPEPQPGFTKPHGVVEQKILTQNAKRDRKFSIKGKSIIVDTTKTAQTVSNIPCSDNTYNNNNNNNNSTTPSSSSTTSRYTPEDRSDLV
jgi:hypothetical protein